jgi:diguanylate cyclase (GGDEF)-like protein
MSDELVFLKEDVSESEITQPWKILIVDDESSVHDVTKLALHRFTFNDRPLEFTSVYSKKEAAKVLENEDFAVAFVDVIMESDEAGLELVNIIRNDIGNERIRIIIRTGQPGSAPERFIIDNYDINDYKEKTELTSDHLYTTLRTALSQYAQLEELADANALLYHRMSYDALTGLPNRNRLNEVLEKGKESSLFMINMDSFSSVNDAYGFEFGDNVLKRFAIEFQQSLVDDETFYHLEADTFALHILHRDKIRLKLLIEEVTEISRRFSFEQDGISVRLSFSMGLVLHEHDNMIQKGDIALKEARTISRNRMQVYSEDMSIIQSMHENREWTKLLNRALEEDSLKPFFQPIMNVKTQEIEKYEALVRMDIDGAIISPIEFLSAARYAGLLHEITKVMLDKTAKAFASNSYKFSINVTDQDFKETEFVSYVKSVFRKYNIDASRVIFELLEEKSLNEIPQARKIISELQDLGCHIAIDDFGVECSNYAQLITHELESIKIDGSFIKELDESTTCHRVVDAIVYFARSMGVKTVAEFVHSQKVYDKAVALGVDYVPGYHIGKPEETIPQ